MLFISQIQHIPVRIVWSFYTGQGLQDITHEHLTLNRYLAFNDRWPRDQRSNGDRWWIIHSCRIMTKDCLWSSIWTCLGIDPGSLRWQRKVYTIRLRCLNTTSNALAANNILNPKFNVNLFLYGEPSINDDDNRKIILSLIQYIKDTNRFSGWPLFDCFYLILINSNSHSLCACPPPPPSP